MKKLHQRLSSPCDGLGADCVIRIARPRPELLAAGRRARRRTGVSGAGRASALPARPGPVRGGVGLAGKG